MLNDMNGFDLVLVAALAVFLLWEAYGLIASRGKIQMKAQIYGRFVAMGIVLVLMGLAIFQRRNELNSVTLWVILGGVLVGCLLYILTPTGFGEKGLYFNGKLTPFEKFQYYCVERETEKGFALRLHTNKREFVLDFAQAQQPLVLAWMSKGKVVDFETHLAATRE